MYKFTFRYRTILVDCDFGFSKACRIAAREFGSWQALEHMKMELWNVWPF